MKQSEKPIDRLDQFFKNKLDDHAIAPSENAWAKVESGLSKKNNVVVWRLAAAVLLMGALVTIIYWSLKSTENEQPALAQKKIEKGELNSHAPGQSKSLSQKTETEKLNTTVNAVKKSSVKSIIQPVKILSEEIQKKETVATVDQVEKVRAGPQIGRSRFRRSRDGLSHAGRPHIIETVHAASLRLPSAPLLSAMAFWASSTASVMPL